MIRQSLVGPLAIAAIAGLHGRRDAVYALGTMRGNYLDLRLTSRIARTRDFKRWDILAEESNLP